MRDQLITWTKAKVHVYSDSVRCLEKMQEHSEANQRWNAQLEDFQQSNSYRELFGIDGEPIEFEWHISQGLLHWRSSKRSKKICRIKTLNFQGWIIFMSMFNDIDWTKKGHSEKCISNSEQVKNYAKRFSRGHWSFLPSGDEEKWYGTLNYAPEGKCDSIATEIVGHPLIKGISDLSRGILRKKKVADVPYTYADSSIQNSCFARFTEQISSVSTEQYQAGVKSSLKGLRIKKSRSWRSP